MSRLVTRSKKEAVYQWLLTRIIEGELAPNTPLVIDELARNLEISPIPIREALQQLEAEGFVVIQPYSSTIVADLKPDMISEIFALLETTEIISGRMACVNICDDQIPQLEALLQRMDELVFDPACWSHENARFHQLICHCSGSLLAADIMKRTLLHWDRLRRYFLDDVFGQRIEKAQQDHWRMYEAIRARDPDCLEAVVREHNRSALRDYIDHLQRTGIAVEQLAWNLNGV